MINFYSYYVLPGERVENFRPPYCAWMRRLFCKSVSKRSKEKRSRYFWLDFYGQKKKISDNRISRELRNGNSRIVVRLPL